MIRTRAGLCFVPLFACLAGCGELPGRASVSSPTPDRAGTARASSTLSTLELAPPPRERIYLEIAPAAAREIRGHTAHMKLERWWLRYTIKGGGCTGFQNKLDLETAPPTPDDFEFVADGIPCVILAWQRPYVRGARIDFGEKAGERGFIVSFPHVAQRPQDATGKPITAEFEQRDANRPAVQQKRTQSPAAK